MIRDTLRKILHEKASCIFEELVRIRRDIHAHPELGFEEVRTSALVASRLRELGLDVRTGLAKTGVAALLEGVREGPTLMLRADMDGLPVDERNEVAYRSRTRGVMHACGHDGHTSILLGAASVLADLREHLQGSVRFVFQPAEENLGGARLMIEHGVLENPQVDAALGLHLITSLPFGYVGLKQGPFMASVDLFTARIHGRSGHSAMPEGSVDAIVTASRIVAGLAENLAAALRRNEGFLVNVGTVRGGTAPNVVADLVELQGTVRCLDDELRPRIKPAMEEYLAGCCSGHGASFELAYEDGYPVLINEGGMTALVKSVSSHILGADKVLEIPPVLASEDMAFYLREVPGCFFFVGAGPVDPSRPIPAHHSPYFDMDERALGLGLEILCACALDYLGTGASRV